jgi:hypothetical protein
VLIFGKVLKKGPASFSLSPASTSLHILSYKPETTVHIKNEAQCSLDTFTQNTKYVVSVVNLSYYICAVMFLFFFLFSAPNMVSYFFCKI